MTELTNIAKSVLGFSASVEIETLKERDASTYAAMVKSADDYIEAQRQWINANAALIKAIQEQRDGELSAALEAEIKEGE